MVGTECILYGVFGFMFVAAFIVVSATMLSSRISRLEEIFYENREN